MKTEDFSRLDNDTFYKGRYPKYANEIGIPGAISKELGKERGKGNGDQVTVNIQYRKGALPEIRQIKCPALPDFWTKYQPPPAWWTVPCRSFVRKVGQHHSRTA
ncbi:hypothetical protein J41TS12_49020 [Paenibacillus antibioticophila]|uniref:Uncharacterized protein n=1 Tax=Paenibacillus antibioticophila TaxID=1274374 RepID=A0A919XVG9_9BACL|nr:hypothetical protein J41TS12_49020 [Paenibacillus antibioticophila]